MKLEGIHHVTAITADAARNVSFYAGTMGLRLVKKTVNQDDATVYHLFYADEKGSPGADLTFFEYPGASKGHAGAGMVHRIVWRVASQDAMFFWGERLSSHGIDSHLDDEHLRFRDFEGLEFELRVVETSDPPLRAEHPEVPSQFAITGFDGVRAYSARADDSATLLATILEFQPVSDTEWSSRGSERGSLYGYDFPPINDGVAGAGTVHHVAWACPTQDHQAWRDKLSRAGVDVTPVIDRFYFRSIYFREPSGVLFEIATMGPGFNSDEPIESLGQRLSLPPKFEHLRSRLEKSLTPLPDPRSQPLV
ncbi:MAG: VOC family protein [Actinomycetota bacterium]